MRCPLCPPGAAEHEIDPSDTVRGDAMDAVLTAHFRAEIVARTAAPFVLPTGPVRKGHPLRARGVRYVAEVVS